MLQLSRSFLLFGAHDGASIPSWAPDWEVSTGPAVPIERRLPEKDIFQACGRAQWTLSRENPDQLHVRGFRLDVIVLNTPREHHTLYSPLSRLRRWLTQLLSMAGEIADSGTSSKFKPEGYYVDGGTIMEAACKTLFRGYAPNQNEGYKMPMSEDELQKLEEWYLDVQVDNPIADDDLAEHTHDLRFEVTETITMPQQADRVAISSDSLIRTSLGYIGVVDCARGLRTQDEIWILAGGFQPVVLRPDPDRKDHYFVQSEAYIHGVC